MIRVLCVCSEGNNRSVTVAQKLKYAGFETLSAGLDRNDETTLKMLFHWADRIIVTARDQVVPDEFAEKVTVWDLGPDTYPRPFNKILLRRVQKLMEERCEGLRRVAVRG